MTRVSAPLSLTGLNLKGPRMSGMVGILAFGFGSFTTGDMLIILALGLLVFGKRLPEVGRSLGKGIVEFKKGLKGVEDEVEKQSEAPARRPELPQS